MSARDIARLLGNDGVAMNYSVPSHGCVGCEDVGRRRPKVIGWVVQMLGDAAWIAQVDTFTPPFLWLCDEHARPFVAGRAPGLRRLTCDKVDCPARPTSFIVGGPASREPAIFMCPEHLRVVSSLGTPVAEPEVKS